jgi:Arc/MetJ family transcription regulator
MKNAPIRIEANRRCEYHKIYITKSGGVCPIRTNIVIEDALMKEAMALSGIKTKKETVDTGLKLLV